MHKISNASNKINMCESKMYVWFATGSTMNDKQTYCAVCTLHIDISIFLICQTIKYKSFVMAFVFVWIFPLIQLQSKHNTVSAEGVDVIGIDILVESKWEISNNVDHTNQPTCYINVDIIHFTIAKLFFSLPNLSHALIFISIVVPTQNRISIQRTVCSILI